MALVSICLCHSQYQIIRRRRDPPLSQEFSHNMGRGVSSGGGQSSLGYLFGSGESPPSAPKPSPTPTPSEKPSEPTAVDIAKQIPAGIKSDPTNNYFREGQNSGNFITDRPSTKVHAAPGGGSSLGYLFGDGSGGRN